jgi:hypothetical protein
VRDEKGMGGRGEGGGVGKCHGMSSLRLTEGEHPASRASDKET